MDGILGVRDHPRVGWLTRRADRAHCHKDSIIPAIVYYSTTIHSGPGEGKRLIRRSLEGFSEPQAPKVLPRGLEWGELGGWPHRPCSSLNKNQCLFPRETCLRLRVQGFHWGQVTLALSAYVTSHNHQNSRLAVGKQAFTMNVPSVQLI